MSTESAVDFPGKYRLHVALTVTNLEESKRFYELLLGVSPSKERPRYAKFEPVDPSVNLTLNEVDGDVIVQGGTCPENRQQIPCSSQASSPRSVTSPQLPSPRVDFLRAIHLV